MKIRTPQTADGTNLTVPADLAAYVEDSLYDANTILAATVDNTPAAVTVAASTIVGRGAAGGIDDLSPASARTVLELDSVATGKGASLIGLEDSATYLAAVNVETAVAELATKCIGTALAAANGAAWTNGQSADLWLTLAAPGETNSLNDPAGPGITLNAEVVALGGGGTRIATAASPINKAGNTIMTFAALRDRITLRAVSVSGGGFAWRVIENDGVTLS